jgi:YidC/Oxa1 family membrane protein insertase
MKNLLTAVTFIFVVFCGWLVIQSELFDSDSESRRGCILLQQATIDEGTLVALDTTEQDEHLEAVDLEELSAIGGIEELQTLGSVDPKSGYKFQLQLTSTGAAIKQAILSEFNDRDYKNPKPLVLLSPVVIGSNRQIFSLANGQLALVQQKQQFPLDRLSWKSFHIERGDNGSHIARFEATIVDSTDKPVIKLTKSYTVIPDSYTLKCNLQVENLSVLEQNVSLNLIGPSGIGKEGFRSDMRKVVAGFKDSQGQFSSTRLDKKKLAKAETSDDRNLQARKDNEHFLWAAVVNKYFAAILVPLPEQGKNYCDWVKDKQGVFYNPDRDNKANSGDETIGLALKVAPNTLGPAGEPNSTRTYDFELYLGPKDKSLFDKNERYRELGFVETIDFLACCCPASIINPLAFGILALMKWMHGFIGNYGVVIIILVFLMRLVMHPITKKSQVSMSKMSKLAPRAEEIKKKYANNKTEMNKQLMALYREQGASPIMGMLPMMVQMPIWIALWSAVYSSIDLRGASFLPFWITDLSAPDALVRFSTITLPLLRWKIESLNLLPILMGLAFYLQQKLMPSQAQASVNPQVAQQQKMMMIMLPLLFPLMLYKAPSGVNLYIMASTFAGVFEQYVIRKHIQKKEEEESKGLVAATSKTGGKVKKKKPKPFFKI